MGMSAEFREKLFEAFSREDTRRVQRTEGTGLGMAITKKIVDAMKGTIDVDTAPGMGTTFHVTLDFEKAKAFTLDQKLPDWRILVVDDNEDLCEAAVQILRDLGTRPGYCLSGEEALVKVMEAQQRKQPYFAVLVDYQLSGMNGAETAKRLRELDGESAYDWADIEDDAAKSGVTGFVAKPLFHSTLYQALNRFNPADGGGEDETPVQSAGKAVSLKGMHILLAEDNPLNAEIATMLLMENGAEVDHAEDGRFAVEMFEDAAPGHYKVILMDLRMPNMNGFEATEAIRRMKRIDAGKVPIIAMTADAFAEDVQKCLAAGMNGHLSKPIDLDALLKTLAKFL